MPRVIFLVRLLGSVLPKSIPLSTNLCLEGGQHWGAEKALALQSEALPLVSVWPLVISLLSASVTSPAMGEQSFPPCRLPRVRGSINTCCSALISKSLSLARTSLSSVQGWDWEEGQVKSCRKRRSEAKPCDFLSNVVLTHGETWTLIFEHELY